MAILGGIMVPHPPLLLPEVGRGGEKEISATAGAYEEAAQFAADLGADTLILSSPHAVMYQDWFHVSPGEGAVGTMSRFGAPQVEIRVSYDVALVAEICQVAAERGIPAGTLGERDASLDHGSMVPLYFLRKYLPKIKLVRIGLSGEPLKTHFALGQAVRDAAKRLGRRIVWIGSGDLSHKLQASGPYGFVPEGPVYDERIMDVMGRADFDALLHFPEDLLDKAAECGHRSFCMMGGALSGLPLTTRRLHHEDKTGVGYGICTYKVEPDTVSDRPLVAYGSGIRPD